MGVLSYHFLISDRNREILSMYSNRGRASQIFGLFGFLKNDCHEGKILNSCDWNKKVEEVGQFLLE